MDPNVSFLGSQESDLHIWLWVLDRSSEMVTLCTSQMKYYPAWYHVENTWSQ